MARVVHRQFTGTGTGTQIFDEPFANAWRLNLDWVPTPGNTLLLVIANAYGSTIYAAAWGSNAGTFCFIGANTNVISWTVEGSPATYIDVQGGLYHSSAVLIEVEGLLSLYPDKTAHVTGGLSSTLTTPETADTTHQYEYWLNTFVYYNGTPGIDLVATGPNNGYALVNDGNPARCQDTGWIWPSGSPTHSALDFAYGLVLADQFVSATGPAGGSITDLHGNTFYWEACALSFQCTAPTISTRECPPGLLTSPTQCWAVLIERADDLKFGLTDATVPFTYDGVVYQVAQGADASNIHQETGTESPDLEISTVVNDALDYVTSTDVRGTRFNNSYWTVFIIDYMNPSNGIMILGVARCSRATINDTGQKFQLKQLMSILEMQTGRTYCASCDVLSTFDKRCDPTGTLLAANSFSRIVGAIQPITSYNMCCDFFGDTNPEYFYNFGNCTWTGGENEGLLSICKVHTVIAPAAWSDIHTYSQGDYCTYGGSTYTSLISSNLNHEPDTSPADWLMVTGNPASVARIVWRTPPPYPMAAGDVCTLVRGCDKIKTTCQSIPNAENPSGTNVENFHGYYLPSPDVALLVGKSNVQ